MPSSLDTVAPPSIHVAIVEDDPAFRDALSAVLQAAPDMRLAHVAATRAAGLAMLQGPPTDVLLVDLGLPDGSGIDEIRSLASGGSPISPIIASQVLARFRTSAGVTQDKVVLPGQVEASSELLSPREMEVLNYITRGFTAQETAKLMQLSPYTVRTFVRRIYGKLKVSSKSEAIYEARTLGLLRD